VGGGRVELTAGAPAQAVARLRAAGAAGAAGAAAAARGGALSAEEEETLACEMGLSRQDVRVQARAPRPAPRAPRPAPRAPRPAPRAPRPAPRAPRAPARHARPAPPPRALPRALPRARRGGAPEAPGAARALTGRAASLTRY
jgi:hypothetical protein